MFGVALSHPKQLIISQKGDAGGKRGMTRTASMKQDAKREEKELTVPGAFSFTAYIKVQTRNKLKKQRPTKGKG